MDKEKINEMKQIQQGLEAFLEQEMRTRRKPGDTESQVRTGRKVGEESKQEADWEAGGAAGREEETDWEARNNPNQEAGWGEGNEADWESGDDTDTGRKEGTGWKIEDDLGRPIEEGWEEENDADWEAEDMEADREMLVDWDAKEQNTIRPTGRKSGTKRQLAGGQRIQSGEYVKKETSVPMGRQQQNRVTAQDKGKTFRAGQPDSPRRTGKAAQPSRTGQPDRSRQTGKAAQPSRSGHPGRAGQPDGSRQTGRAAQPDKSGQSTQPGKAIKSGKRDRSGNPVQAGHPAQPGGSDKPVRSDGAGKKPKKKVRKKRSGFLKFLIAAALIVGLLGAGLHKVVGIVYDKMNFKEIASVAELPMKEDGVVNILLIGNDSRENGDDGRSDAMILLSVSSKTKSIYMTSLLRDMYVEIPGHDGNRLNAAYAYGGAELLMETIENNFDITVNRYVLVNFEAFANLVDAVGGVDLDLTSQEIEYVNGYLVEYNMLTGRPQGTDDMDTSLSGMVHLNGPQALAYSRNRYLGTDFGRTERQRKVLTAVLNKLPTALLSNTKELMDGLLPNLTTNLTQNECFQLSLMAGKLLTYDIISDNIPQPGTYKDAIIRKMEVLEVDFETNIKYLKEKIYGE